MASVTWSSRPARGLGLARTDARRTSRRRPPAGGGRRRWSWRPGSGSRRRSRSTSRPATPRAWRRLRCTTEDSGVSRCFGEALDHGVSSRHAVGASRTFCPIRLPQSHPSLSLAACARDSWCCCWLRCWRAWPGVRARRSYVVPVGRLCDLPAAEGRAPARTSPARSPSVSGSRPAAAPTAARCATAAAVAPRSTRTAGPSTGPRRHEPRRPGQAEAFIIRGVRRRRVGDTDALGRRMGIMYVIWTTGSTRRGTASSRALPQLRLSAAARPAR